MSAKEHKNLAPIRSGGPIAGIIPQSIEDVWRLAKLAFKAGMLKRQKVRGEAGQYVDEDDEAVMSRATMSILQGLEIGMPAMASIQLIALVGTRLVVHSEGVPAILWSKGFKLKEWEDGEGDKRTAHCRLTRPDGEVIERSFSVQQAIKAKLWSPQEKITKKGKAGSSYEADNDSAWHRFDFRMLMHRARGYAANDGGSDALRGIGIREIVEDARTIDITPETTPTIDADIPDETVAEVVSEAEASQDAPFPDPEKYLGHLGDELEAAADKDVFDEIWQSHLDGSDGRLSREHQDAAQALHAKHIKRFEAP